MKYFFAALALSLALPVAAFAQSGVLCFSDADCAAGEYCYQESGECLVRSMGSGAGGLNTARVEALMGSIVDLINFVLVPLLMAIAFIVFLWGVFNYFIWGATSDEKLKTGKAFVMYGIIGFVVIISLWGIVYVGIELLGFGAGGGPPPYPEL